MTLLLILKTMKTLFFRNKFFTLGDQLRNQFFKRFENPRSSGLSAVQGQISSRTGVSNSCWPPVITEVPGDLVRAVNKNWRQALLWSKVGGAYPKAFPWPPVPHL